MQAPLNCSFIPFLPWEKKLQNLCEKKVVTEEKMLQNFSPSSFL